MTQDSQRDASTDRPTPTGHRAPDRSRGVAVRLVLAIAAAWALSVGTYLLQVAWVVPLVVLVCAVSLIRGGRGLLDRVVLAAALLYGSVVAAGLLLSVWPWRLHPVSAGGVALTALVAFAYLTRRWPSLPRPSLADGLSIAAAGFVGLVLFFPPFWRGTQVQISHLTFGEDGIRHFIEFDTIRQLGGYLFLQQDVQPGMAHYPQGWHFTFGLLDSFVRSSAEPGSGLSALNHYLWYAALTYAAFALAFIWGIQRLAEPLLTPARRLVLVAVAVAFLLSDDAFVLAMLHYTPQVAALALVTVLAVVLARPPARPVLTLWLVSALVVGLGFTYTLYLPPAVLAVLVWLYARRHSVARHRAMLVVTLLALLLAAVPLVLGLLVARQADGLLGPTTMGSMDGLLLMASLAAVGLLRSWRVARWRVLRWALGSAAVCLVGLYLMLWVLGGSGSYYYAYKVQTLIVVLLVLAGGSLLALLPTPQRAEQPWRWRARGTWPPALRRLAPAGLLALALAAGSGLVVGDSPYQQNEGAVYARSWVSGSWYAPPFLARAAQSEARREVTPGTLTIVMGDDAALAYLGQTLVTGVLRQYRDLRSALISVPYTSPDYYDNMIESLPPGPLLIVVDIPRTERRAERLRERHPDRDISIEYLLE